MAKEMDKLINIKDKTRQRLKEVKGFFTYDYYINELLDLKEAYDRGELI